MQGARRTAEGTPYSLVYDLASLRQIGDVCARGVELIALAQTRFAPGLHWVDDQLVDRRRVHLEMQFARLWVLPELWVWVARGARREGTGRGSTKSPKRKARKTTKAGTHHRQNLDLLLRPGRQLVQPHLPSLIFQSQPGRFGTRRAHPDVGVRGVAHFRTHCQ